MSRISTFAVEDLLRVLLVLVIAWVGLQLLTDVLAELLGPLYGTLKPVVGVVVLVLVVLWLLDRL